MNSGYHNFPVSGIHLSSYGLDFITKDSGDYLEGVDVRKQAYGKGFLIDILEKIHEIEGLKRLRVGSLEPRIITSEFALRLKKMEKLCPHFHLSLQSGCNATLKRMNRFYTAEEYKEKVALLREVFEQPAITTDVIVGFPGETEEEFKQTYEYLKEINFFEMHVFKYSKRKGTIAAERKDQIPEDIKAKRSEILLELAKEQSAQYRRTYLGKEITVLIEETKNIQGEEYQIGHTSTYVKAAIKKREDMKNQFIQGKAVDILKEEYLFVEAP